MKNMAILLDTNVLLNYLTNRDDPELEASEKIIELCAKGKIDGYMAFHSLSTIWFVLRKVEDSTRREMLRDLCSIINVSAASQSEVMAAIDKAEFKDFEDCLQDKCAKEAEADYIVTCNIRDYSGAEIEAIVPSKLLSIILELMLAAV